MACRAPSVETGFHFYIHLVFAFVSLCSLRCVWLLAPLMITTGCRLCITSCVWTSRLHERVSTYWHFIVRFFLLHLRIDLPDLLRNRLLAKLSVDNKTSRSLSVWSDKLQFSFECFCRGIVHGLLVAGPETCSSSFPSVPLPGYNLAFVSSGHRSSMLLTGDRYRRQRGYNSRRVKLVLSKPDAMLQMTHCFLVKPLCSRWGKEKESECTLLYPISTLSLSMGVEV